MWSKADNTRYNLHFSTEKKGVKLWDKILSNRKGNFNGLEHTAVFETTIWLLWSTDGLPIICNDAKDNVISQPDLILERWKDYFHKFLNISEAIDIQNIIRERTNNEPQIPLPSYNEICFIINNLKLNKAAVLITYLQNCLNMEVEH